METELLAHSPYGRLMSIIKSGDVSLDSWLIDMDLVPLHSHEIDLSHLEEIYIGDAQEDTARGLQLIWRNVGGYLCNAMDQADTDNEDNMPESTI